MPGAKYPSLRKLLFVGIFYIAAIVVTLSVAIVLLTSALHNANVAMGVALNNVSILEQAQTDLLARDRAKAPETRATFDSRILASLARARPVSDTPESREQLDEATRQVEQYLDTPGADMMPAFRAIGRLSGVSVTHATDAKVAADYWNNVANILSVVAAVLALFGLFVALHRSSRTLVRPLSALTEAVRKFGAGQSDVRAPIAGVSELREISLRFNDMASAQARRREALLVYVASVAHDLRNPIAALRLSTQSISADGPLPSEERIRRTLGVLHRQGLRLERMVEDLMDTARIEAGQLELHFDDNDAGELATAVLDLYRGASPSHELVLALPPESIEVRSDAARIEQALTNLLSNAIKYSPKGGTVTLRVEQRGDEIVYSVTDEGIGIASEDLPFIWEPFRRVGVEGALIPGLGLGLSTVKRIVEAHGGHVDVQSERGHGSVFSICLPQQGPPDQPPVPHHRPTRDAPSVHLQKAE